MDVLALQADHRKANRTFGLVLGLQVIPVLLCVGFSVYFVAQGATYVLVVFLAPVLIMVPTLIVQAQIWTATRRITHPVELTPRGISIDTAEGRLAVGWDALTGLTVTAPHHSPVPGVRFHPQVAPGAPGVVSSLTPRTWRILRRRGLQLAVPLTGITPEELAAAVRHFSSGRWCPVPPADRQRAVSPAAQRPPGPGPFWPGP